MGMNRSARCGLMWLWLVLPAAGAWCAEPTPWTMPDIEQLPKDKYGELVRYGRDLTERTFALIGPEVAAQNKRFAGNNLACKSCHLANGTQSFAMPYIGAYATFPQYRAREDEVSTLEERVNGCLQRSMNGRSLPLASREMKALIAYMQFLSTGLKVGEKYAGQGTKAIVLPKRAASVAAGKDIYAATCVVCHGEEGLGKRVGVVGDAQGYLFPPLWGKDSFNTGAGMNRLIVAAQFIRYNMPFGVTHQTATLTDEQAYDVAAYVLSQPRPAMANLDRDFPARWNKPVDAAFPPYVDGAPAEQHKYGPFQPLQENMKKLRPSGDK